MGYRPFETNCYSHHAAHPEGKAYVSFWVMAYSFSNQTVTYYRPLSSHFYELAWQIRAVFWFQGVLFTVWCSYDKYFAKDYFTGPRERLLSTHRICDMPTSSSLIFHSQALLCGFVSCSYKIISLESWATTQLKCHTNNGFKLQDVKFNWASLYRLTGWFMTLSFVLACVQHQW